MTDKTYRVAIIGLGRMGSTIDDEFPDRSPPYSVAASCNASQRLQVVTGADIDASKRAAFSERWGVDALYEDYVEMIRKEDPDMVAVCTRGHLHAEMATRSAEEGVKLIFCEKAIACSMEEADGILKAVQEKGALFNSGVLRRFNLRYHQARDLIRNGEIGEPKAAIHYASTNLLHGHIHSIDTLSFLLDDPKVESIWGELNTIDHRIPDNRLEDDPYGIFQLTFANGIAATSVPAGNWEFEVMGDGGSVRVFDNGTSLQLRMNQAGKSRIAADVPVEPVPEHSATQYCLEDLVLAHEEGRQTLGPVEVAHHLTEVCLALAESHRQEKRINLPLENRSLYIFHR
ncbi:MAG: Gfo/Idh/MocA family oxidoreductase [Caldilineaceae bacterium SB0668_bin_21]|nr:Gfo/Idh/MocA family oxidoreductase [Caldilineaceae bacterium SB0668_bin_21]MYC20544.1 Gfo/Idh/MocA family oxidoreductase [Caldilineaceae bacterium SB0662_bin_25]